jgi:3-isopropylmalate dehydrogenase
MKLRITLLPGDGIGPEVTAEAVRVLRGVADLTGYEFQFSEHLIGGAAIRATGVPLPEATIEACLKSHAVFLGAVGSPEFDSMPREKKPETGLLGLRKALGGFANLRPVKTYPALAAYSPLKPELLVGVDIMTVRELLGGLYFGEPRGFVGDGAKETGFNTMSYSRPEVERVAHVAFKLARSRRGKLTSVDKANVLESSQLWRRVVTEVAREYPEVKLEHGYVDSFAMRLVTAPAGIDVVLTENLFGDILSDESGVLGGSLGMLASATLGGKVDLYEPVHGSAPDIAGKGIANPIGAIASAAMLLRHTAKLEEDANSIETAIDQVIAAGHRTKDLGGSVSTTKMGELVDHQCADMIQRRMSYHAV